MNLFRGVARAANGALLVMPRPTNGIGSFLRRGGLARDVESYAFVEDAAIPNGALRNRGIALTADGAMYVTDTAPSAASYRRGMAVRADGALHVNSGAVTNPRYVNGVAIDADGRVYISSPIYKDSSLAAWFRFNSGITVTGAGVSQWDDQSGNGRHLKQGTDANRPSKEADGSILFDGTAHFLKCDAFTLNQPETVYWLGQSVTWQTSAIIWDGNGPNSGTLQQVTASPQVRIFAGAGVTGQTLPDDAYAVAVAVYNGASSLYHINNATPSTGDAGASNLGGFTLGHRADESAGFASNIQVKEVLIYAAAHDAATRARVIRYLSMVGGIAI